MVLSTRVSLQWLPRKPEELTNTMVFTSPNNHFVDVRIYKDAYPFKQSGKTPEKFENIFEWVIVGEEEEIEGTNKIIFNHSINSQEIMRSIAVGKPLSECRSDPDVGTFWEIEGSDDRKETGAMLCPETSQMTNYIEIWRSLNPNQTSFQKEVREGYDDNGKPDMTSLEIAMTFDLKAKGFVGRIIRLGNWVQGVIYEEAEIRAPLSVMRGVRDRDSGSWAELITYGKHKFPNIYQSGESKGDWKRVE